MDSYLVSVENKEVISYFSYDEIEENKEFLKNINKYLSNKVICELLDCKKTEINDLLKKLYAFLNQCVKSMKEYEKKFNKFKRCISKCFNPYTGEYSEDINYKDIDTLFSIYKNQLQAIAK